NDARDTDAARFSQPLQACRHVDTIAEDIAAVADNVADIDANTKSNIFLGGHRGIAFNHAALNVDGTADGVDNADKFHQHAVASRLYYSTSMFDDLGIDHLLAVGFERTKGAFLIFAHKPAVTGDISRYDRRKSSFDAIFGHATGPSVCSRQLIASLPERQSATDICCGPRSCRSAPWARPTHSRTRSLFHERGPTRSTVQQFAHVGHRTLRPIVNDELEDIGPRIVPGSVEVELAASDMFEINFGVEDRLTGKIRTREHAPERIDDGAAAAHHYRIRIVAKQGFVNIRIHASLDILACGQHEASPFERDVLHGWQPSVAIVRGRRTIDGDALRKHVHAQHRHVVFPADDGSDAAKRRLKYRHGRSIPETPDQTLARSRHQLAVLTDQALRSIEEQHRAIESAAVALNAADDCKHAGVSRRRSDCLDGIAVESDGRLVVSAERLAPLWLAQSDGSSERSAFWIAADE